ncbi:MAG TPA: FKBP-type peptidyl-prolyl cis-trans isomerase [Edaphocola sp.]|nr:FKBP-type peptidyl-prolyl cis-trans isomerase [Edaphocola sp.]
MKKINFIILLGALSILVACNKKKPGDGDQIVCKETTSKASTADSIALSEYIIQNQIEAEYDTNGFYYRIITPGNETKPEQCGNAIIDYVGKFKNEAIFDSRNNFNMYIGSAVPGFKKGITYIGEGGEIELFIPPSLAYGNDDYNSIPGGSTLIFKIKVRSVIIE